jgi:hypothetical protein
MNDDIYLYVYGEADAVIVYGNLPARTWLHLKETGDMIVRIKYSVGHGRLCQIDQPTLRKEIVVGQDKTWQLHIKGC